MGFCLESTPEMGEYSAEVRRESFYLQGEDLFDHLYDGGELPRHVINFYPQTGPGDKKVNMGNIEVLIEDIPKIRAALDAVEEYVARTRQHV